jgi:hypothetical protein
MNIKSIIYSGVVTIVWEINGVPDYGFGKDKQLYNLKTSKRLTRTVKGYTQGYYIKGKFYTLNKLKPLLIRPTNFDVPF